MPIIAKQSDYLIFHVGANDARFNTSRKIIDDLYGLKCNIFKKPPNCRIVVSKPNLRLSNRNFNNDLKTLNLRYPKNGKISVQHLGRKGFHLD